MENNVEATSWKGIDFPALKKANLASLNRHLEGINEQQKEHRRDTTQKELEQVEYLQNENVALQRELARTIEGKRAVMGEIALENTDFQGKYAARVAQKDSLRQQIADIEHLIRQLRLEIETTTTDTQRVHVIKEKEEELRATKANEERRIAKVVTDDIREQIRALEEQFNVATATQTKQEEIELRLKTHYDKACKDLDLALQDALKKKNQQVQDLFKIQEEVQQKRADNEIARLKNTELEHELEILERYAETLQDNI